MMVAASKPSQSFDLWVCKSCCIPNYFSTTNVQERTIREGVNKFKARVLGAQYQEFLHTFQSRQHAFKIEYSRVHCASVET